MKISAALHLRKVNLIAGMERERLPWWNHWRILAEYYLPSRYVTLETDKERRVSRRNDKILDSTGTRAARVLASGMMNGITSPARPWFKLRVVGIDDENPAASAWTDEVERRMLRVMAESNFYQAMAMLYLDLVIFNTACAFILEHERKVINCYNPPLGEFYLMQGADHHVNGLGRQFRLNVHQVVEEFGEENVSPRVLEAWKAGNARLLEDVEIVHLIEPNLGYETGVAPQFRYIEYYWEKGQSTGMVLRRRGWEDFPAIAPRWELTGNDVYGTGPGMEALGDVIQLQHETMKKAQGLDKLISPPVLVDIQLQNKPTALLPNGVTFVPRLDATNGARPIYTVNPPLGEMTADLRDIQARIRETFHNELFQMISQLDTVRSAAEIDARREEKLVLLGPVLERFESEGLDPAIKRIFAIMDRKGLLPPPPEELQGGELEIQYVSILSSAQSAVGTAPIERWLALIGNLVQVFPEAREVPDVIELIRDYGRDIGVKAKNIKPRRQIEEAIAARNKMAEEDRGLEQASVAAQGAKVLSETEVGGGVNAIQALLGG